MARRSRPVLYEVVRRGERQRQASWLSRLISALRGGESTRYASGADERSYEDPETHPTNNGPELQETAETRETPAQSASKAASSVAEPRRSSAVEEHAAVAPAPPQRTETPYSSAEPIPTSSSADLRSADGQPWQLTLNRSSLLATIFGVVILVLVAFQIGQQSAGPDTNDDFASNTDSPDTASNPSRTPTRYVPQNSTNTRDNADVALPERRPQRAVADEPLQPEQRRTIESVPKGRYLVVQNLGVQRRRDQRIPDGERIVAHLASKGIQAKIIQPGRKPPHVIVAAPLDGMSTAAIENLKARVRRAGNDFPGYNFSDCYETSF